MKKFIEKNRIKILIVIIFIAAIGGIFYEFFTKALQNINKSREVIANELTNEEISEISKSIVSVDCIIDFNNNNSIEWEEETVYGSGTYIHRSLIDGKERKEPFDHIDGYVLTNAHVVTPEPVICEAYLFDKKFTGALFYDGNAYFLNDILDVALLKTKETDKGIRVVYSIDNETRKGYLLKDYSFCPKDKIIGSKVYVFGYPMTGAEYVEYSKDDLYIPITKSKKLVRNLIVSTGIISGMDSYENYYTDAKIDSGLSGGLAVAKINNEICILGIPTWASGGNIESLGLIQPFWKISNVFKIIEL